LRGLGLLLTKNKDETPVRCAVALFQARKGTLTAQTLVIDTDPVLITGGGTITLDTEALDLQIQGHPKHVRLFRLKAPVAIQGTLRHPSIGVDKEDRKFQLVDPGHGKDVDCTTLLAETKTGAPALP
jgi:AsmA family protein